MIRKLRKFRRYTRTLNAVLMLLFALGTVHSVWARAAGMHPIMPMTNCDMGKSCPFNNEIVCDQTSPPAIPSMASTDKAPDPIWVAIPVAGDVFAAIHVTDARIDTHSDCPVIPAGPPLHVRFCSFLK